MAHFAGERHREGYQKCRAAIEKLVRQAEKCGAILSIEPYWQNVIDSIDRAERLFRDVDSPSLRLVMDPCNYYRKQDLPDTVPMLKEMFKRLGDKIIIAHAKDVKASANGTDLPASGKGCPRLSRLSPAADRAGSGNAVVDRARHVGRRSPGETTCCAAKEGVKEGEAGRCEGVKV